MEEDLPSRFEHYFFQTVGNVGFYQLLVVLVCCYIEADTTMLLVWPTFARLEAPFVCDDTLFGNRSGIDYLEKNITLQGTSSDQCSYEWSICGKVNYGDCATEKRACSHWTFNYTYSEVSSGMQDDFNLVCSREHWLKIHGSAYFGGLIIGFPFGGLIGDRIGRVKTIRIAVLLKFICGFVIYFAETLAVNIMAWLLMSVSFGICWVCHYNWACEIVYMKVRNFTTLTITSFAGVGAIACAVTAMFIQGWRELMLVLNCSSVILISCAFLLHESPRWLWSQKRYSESIGVMKRMARINGKDLPKELQTSLDLISNHGIRPRSLIRTLVNDVKVIFSRNKPHVKSQERFSIVDVIKHKRMRIRFICQALHWIAANTIYYGLLFGSSLFSQSLHIYIIVQGVATSMGSALGCVLLIRIGRKPLMMASLFVAGVCVLSAVFVDQSDTVVTLFLSFLGKFAIQIVFSLVYMWSGEMMPTVVRASAVGTGSMIARITGLALPYYALLSEKIWEPLTLITYAAIAFLVMISGIALPETKGKILPDTLEEGEAFGTKYYKKKAPSANELDSNVPREQVVVLHETAA